MKTKITISLTLIAISFGLSCTKTKEKLPDPLEAGWNGKRVCKVLEDNKSIRVLKCTFPPNVGHELHYHQPHFGYTLAGSTFRIKDKKGTREVNVPSGYAFSNEELTTHEVLNIGDSTAIFLITEYK